MYTNMQARQRQMRCGIGVPALVTSSSVILPGVWGQGSDVVSSGISKLAFLYQSQGSYPNSPVRWRRGSDCRTKACPRLSAHISSHGCPLLESQWQLLRSLIDEYLQKSTPLREPRCPPRIPDFCEPANSVTRDGRIQCKQARACRLRRCESSRTE